MGCFLKILAKSYVWGILDPPLLFEFAKVSMKIVTVDDRVTENKLMSLIPLYAN